MSKNETESKSTKSANAVGQVVQTPVGARRLDRRQEQEPLIPRWLLCDKCSIEMWYIGPVTAICEEAPLLFDPHLKDIKFSFPMTIHSRILECQKCKLKTARPYMWVMADGTEYSLLNKGTFLPHLDQRLGKLRAPTKLYLGPSYKGTREEDKQKYKDRDKVTDREYVRKSHKEYNKDKDKDKDRRSK